MTIMIMLELLRFLFSAIILLLPEQIQPTEFPPANVCLGLRQVPFPINRIYIIIEVDTSQIACSHPSSPPVVMSCRHWTRFSLESNQRFIESNFHPKQTARLFPHCLQRRCM